MTRTGGQETAAARLKQVRKSLGHTQAEMAAALGILLQSYSRYERAERDLPAPILARIVEYGFSADWIITGIGAMRIRETSLPVVEAPSATAATGPSSGFLQEGSVDRTFIDKMQAAIDEWTAINIAAESASSSGNYLSSEEYLRALATVYDIGPYKQVRPATSVPFVPRRKPSRLFGLVLFLLGFRKVDGVLDRAAAISDEHALFEKGLNQAKPMPDAHLEAVRTVVEDSLVRNISHHSPARQLRDERGCDE